MKPGDQLIALELIFSGPVLPRIHNILDHICIQPLQCNYLLDPVPHFKILSIVWKKILMN